jgi:hypothetical protein
MSDDYTRVSTPSTEDVREYFAFGDFHGWSERVPERYELFDRWLAEHDRQVLYGYVKTPGLGAVAAAISTQCGHKWEDIPPMSANAYLRMAQAVLDLFEEAPHD